MKNSKYLSANLLNSGTKSNQILERIIPFQCPYCKQMCFAIKNFSFEIIEFVDNFAPKPTYHQCQFIWQNFTQTPPINIISKANVSLSNLPEDYRFPASLRDATVSNLGLLWHFTPENWYLMKDNGTLHDREIKRFAHFTRGILLKWIKTKNGRIPKSKQRLTQHIFLKSPLANYQELTVIEIIFSAEDESKIERQIQNINRQLKLINQQPLTIIPYFSRKDDQEIIYHRKLLVLHTPAADNIFSYIAWPNWLEVNLEPKNIKLKASHSFPVD
ncbi:MAG: hypothetical protein JJV97_03205 [SAR324 cluster bacterium]|nr:hypothetical protein [SAR324 cluster bacterium]